MYIINLSIINLVKVKDQNVWIVHININLNYLATGLNFTLSISFSTSSVDFCMFDGIFLRSSILWSCKLALLAICGVVGGRSESGSESGGGGGDNTDFISSALLGKDATDASTR